MSEEILRIIEESMELEPGSIKPGQELEWDSIAVITFMAIVDERLGKVVPADALSTCKTTNDVCELLNS